MKTQKSADARSRSPKLIPDIHDCILTALETYQAIDRINALFCDGIKSERKLLAD